MFKPLSAPSVWSDEHREPGPRMQSLTWYVNRLSRMSAAECAHRLAEAARTGIEQIAPRVQHSTPAPEGLPARHVFAPGDLTVDPHAYMERADRWISGRFDIFQLQGCDLGPVPNWNRDPLTGRTAPLRTANTLDYRDEMLVGSIKHLWEPNRHLHLPGFAQAYVLTGDLRYARAIRAHLESWMDQCPVGRGPNWCSSLELAIRLINWSVTWQWIGGYDSAMFSDADGSAFRDRWLACVYEHTRAIMRRLSRFSSANNHLIGEAAGVWVAAVTWDCWPQLRDWGLRCRQILLEEMTRQNAPDGGNREQAFAYQQFVLDFFLIAGLAGRACGEDFSARYWNRMERMLEFLASMMDVAGRLPMIGDADDGFVLALSPQSGFDNARSLIATGAVLFDRDDFAARAGALDHKTRWLLGHASATTESLQRFATKPARTFQPRRAFPQSGYYLLGSDFGTPQEVRMLVDAGPLGYLSIAAHGHADALSIALNVGGHEILVDPGTYCYHTELQWRRYFRSTRAHNTAVIDGEDQSQQLGAFMWARHAVARCTRFEAAGPVQYFAGEHDGYRRFSDPLTHRRAITYFEAERRFRIVDAFLCRKEHEVELRWHFAESLQPVLQGDVVEVRAGGRLIRFTPEAPPHSTQRIYAGDPSQGGWAQGGWVSRSFGRKAPAVCVCWRFHIHGTSEIATQIQLETEEAR